MASNVPLASCDAFQFSSRPQTQSFVHLALTEIMSLLDYLTTKNPTIDSINSKKGRPTENAKWPPITGCEPLHFDYDTIMSMFSDVLRKKFDGPSTSLKLSSKEEEVSDEDSLKVGPLRDIIPKVNIALRFSIEEYYRDIETIEICGGGYAPKKRKRRFAVSSRLSNSSRLQKDNIWLCEPFSWGS